MTLYLGILCAVLLTGTAFVFAGIASLIAEAIVWPSRSERKVGRAVYWITMAAFLYMIYSPIVENLL